MEAIQRLKQKLNEHKKWETQISMNRWDFIKQENTINTNLYYIEEGCVHAYFLENKKERSMYFGFEESLITDLSSFLSSKKSALNIKCIKKTKAKVISKIKLDEFIQNDPEISKLWIDVLSELSLWNLEREIDLLHKSPTARLERILSRQPQLLQNVPHKYIASYLGMSPESLSRIHKS